MNLKDLVTKVSAETSLPAAQAKKVVNAVLAALRENVLSGENFSSPGVIVRAVTRQSKEMIDEQGVKTLVGERKIGRLIPRESKPRLDT
jgi:hypothetical protein